MKTLLILGNVIGGVGTSTVAAHITEVIRLLGHSIRLLDGDSVNRTVSQMCPSAMPIDVTNFEEVIQLFRGLRNLNADTIVLDTPASSSSAFKCLFETQQSDPPQKFGIRVVVGTVIDQTEYSVSGAAEWIQAFPEEVCHLLIVNSVGEPGGDDTRRRLLQSRWKGRMVRMPQIGRQNTRILDPQKALSSIAPISGWLTGLDTPLA